MTQQDSIPDLIERLRASASQWFANPRILDLERLIHIWSEQRKVILEQAKEINRQKEALAVVADYLSDRADADCDQDGYIPNDEMKLQCEIDFILNGARV